MGDGGSGRLVKPDPLARGFDHPSGKPNAQIFTYLQSFRFAEKVEKVAC